MPIYLDNSSTTFPKPPAVVEAIAHYLTDCGVNVSRGGYRAAYAAEDLVFSTRERLAAARRRSTDIEHHPHRRLAGI